MRRQGTHLRTHATAVVNLDDEIVVRMLRPGQRTVGFSLRRGDADFRLLERGGERWLAAGADPLMPVEKLRLPGRHNAANALAALAVGSVCGFTREAMTGVLGSFGGLPHRTERVRDWRGIAWIDDSKGTNVGATVAAIEGLDGPLVLIAGGEGKGQDFRPARPGLQGQGEAGHPDRPRCTAPCGRDREKCPSPCRTRWNRPWASRRPSRGRAYTVLLSPACASFDMFRDYAHRGEAFAAAVRELPA
jgi:UDP-N-acetylmuramoylalanine--D-glutamate ligase